MKVYIHGVAGRLRVRSKRIKRDPALAERVGQSLLEVAGVHTYRVNRYAGSIVIQYDPHLLTHEAVQALCRDHCLFQSGRSKPAVENTVFVRGEPGKIADGAGELIGKAIFRAFVEQTLERSVFSMVTAVLK